MNELIESIENQIKFNSNVVISKDDANKLLQALTSVKSEQVCPICNGDGVTIEAECCRKGEEQCCGIPIPVQVQCENCQSTGYVPSVKSESAEEYKQPLQEFIDSRPYYGSCTTEYKEGIEDGAKWMHDFANKSEAMKEGEERYKSIEFALWISKNGFYRNASQTNLLWVTDEQHYSGCLYTNDELYTEYLTNKEK